MSAVSDLLAECQAKGIRLLPAGNGGLTVDASRGVLTNELMEQLRVYKPELVADLRVADHRDDDRFEEWVELRRPDGGLSWIHPQHADADLEVIDLPAACPECGRLEMWQTLAGNWRCERCDPPTKSWELMRLAERLKNDPTQWRVPRGQHLK